MWKWEILWPQLLFVNGIIVCEEYYNSSVWVSVVFALFTLYWLSLCSSQIGSTSFTMGFVGFNFYSVASILLLCYGLNIRPFGLISSTPPKVLPQNQALRVLTCDDILDEWISVMNEFIMANIVPFINLYVALLFVIHWMITDQSDYNWSTNLKCYGTNQQCAIPNHDLCHYM